MCRQQDRKKQKSLLEKEERKLKKNERRRPAKKGASKEEILRPTSSRPRGPSKCRSEKRVMEFKSSMCGRESTEHTYSGERRVKGYQRA